jgi:hypothetical protein
LLSECSFKTEWQKTGVSGLSLKRVEQGFDAAMTSASCNSQFLVSSQIYYNTTTHQGLALLCDTKETAHQDSFLLCAIE